MSEPIPGQIPPPQPEKKGCGGTILMILAVVFIVLIGGCVALFISGKKMLEKEGVNFSELKSNPELIPLKVMRGVLAKSAEFEVSPLNEADKSFTVKGKKSGAEITVFMDKGEVKLRDQNGVVYDAAKMEELLNKTAKSLEGATPAPAPAP